MKIGRYNSWRFKQRTFSVIFALKRGFCLTLKRADVAKQSIKASIKSRISFRITDTHSTHIKGLADALVRLNESPIAKHLATVIPGRIAQVTGSAQGFQWRVKRKTDAGYQCQAKDGGMVQDVFLVFRRQGRNEVSEGELLAALEFSASGPLGAAARRQRARELRLAEDRAKQAALRLEAARQGVRPLSGGGPSAGSPAARSTCATSSACGRGAAGNLPLAGDSGVSLSASSSGRVRCRRERVRAAEARRQAREDALRELGEARAEARRRAARAKRLAGGLMDGQPASASWGAVPSRTEGARGNGGGRL